MSIHWPFLICHPRRNRYRESPWERGTEKSSIIDTSNDLDEIPWADLLKMHAKKSGSGPRSPKQEMSPLKRIATKRKRNRSDSGISIALWDRKLMDLQSSWGCKYCFIRRLLPFGGFILYHLLILSHTLLGHAWLLHPTLLFAGRFWEWTWEADLFPNSGHTQSQTFWWCGCRIFQGGGTQCGQGGAR